MKKRNPPYGLAKDVQPAKEAGRPKRSYRAARRNRLRRANKATAGLGGRKIPWSEFNHNVTAEFVHKSKWFG